MEGDVRRTHEPNNAFHSVGKVKDDDEAWPVIIGGMVLDIHATPSIPITPGSTTPGKVRYILGGVARNVAECVSKLGTKPYMISVVGLDMAGLLLLEHWKSVVGLSIEGIQRRQDVETAIVCNIFDVKGELAAGVASVEGIEKFLTPEWIQRFKDNISSAPIVMVDANLSPHALEESCRLAAEYDIPTWFEPVSVAKSRRVASVAKHITFASPNEDELFAMANALSGGDIFCPIQTNNSKTKCSTESLFQMLKPAILALLEKGIKVVIVTLGSDGLFLCSKGRPEIRKSGSKRNELQSFEREFYEIVNSRCPPNQFFSASKSEGGSYLFAMHFPALSASVVRLTGAGDCLVGGTLAAFCAGLDVLQSVAIGIAAARAAVEAETNVPAEYSLAKIADDARSVYLSAKIIFCQSKL